MMGPHLVCVGGEDHAFRIPFLLSLRQKGFQVTAVSSGSDAAFLQHDIPHNRYGFDRFSSGSGGAIGTIRKLISELRPDIVQSFDTKPNLVTPLAVRGAVPVIRTINGLGWTFSSREPRAMALRPVFCGLQWVSSRWTAATVFQNRDDQTFFERCRLVARGTSHLIRSSGIDVDGFARSRQSAPSSQTMREELGLASAEVIIFVGRLTREKGIPTLLKAVPRVLEKRPNARFVLVGPWESEGPFAVEKSEIERHSPHVIALGPRRDVPALLGMADLFAFPTQYREGVPRVLLEAGLAGLPIVASNMPGCNEVVEPGWNGYLVPPGDADAFASQINQVLSDRARGNVMGVRSIEFVKQHFALPLVVDQYCDLYERVLGAIPRSGTAHQVSRISKGAVIGGLDGVRQ